MSVKEELRRGELARQLLNNELYSESFDTVRKALVDKWIASSVNDREGHHELKLMLKLLDNLEHHIKTALDTGKLAEIQLDKDRRMDKLKAAGI